MTVQNLTPSVNYTGTGNVTVFSFSFRALETDDILATVDDVIYPSTVTLNPDQEADPGGTVEFDAAPPLNSLVNIRRETDRDQETAYPNYDRFPAEAHETALDKLTMIVQELWTDLSSLWKRALIFPELEPNRNVVPTVEERSGKLFGWNKDGDPAAVNMPDGSIVDVQWGAINGVLSDQTDLQNALDSKIGSVYEDKSPQLGGIFDVGNFPLTSTNGPRMVGGLRVEAGVTGSSYIEVTPDNLGIAGVRLNKSNGDIAGSITYSGAIDFLSIAGNEPNGVPLHINSLEVPFGLPDSEAFITWNSDGTSQFLPRNEFTLDKIVPTPGTVNTPTWNINDKTSGMVISADGKTATNPDATIRGVRSVKGHTGSGKYYAELVLGSDFTANDSVSYGVWQENGADPGYALDSDGSYRPADGVMGRGLQPKFNIGQGTTWSLNPVFANPDTNTGGWVGNGRYGPGDVIGIALDLDTGQIGLSINGGTIIVTDGTYPIDDLVHLYPTNETYFIDIVIAQANSSITLNTLEADLQYLPAGYQAWDEAAEGVVAQVNGSSGDNADSFVVAEGPDEFMVVNKDGTAVEKLIVDTPAQQYLGNQIAYQIDGAEIGSVTCRYRDVDTRVHTARLGTVSIEMVDDDNDASDRIELEVNADNKTVFGSSFADLEYDNYINFLIDDGTRVRLESGSITLNGNMVMGLGDTIKQKQSLGGGTTTVDLIKVDSAEGGNITVGDTSLSTDFVGASCRFYHDDFAAISPNQVLLSATNGGDSTNFGIMPNSATLNVGGICTFVNNNGNRIQLASDYILLDPSQYVLLSQESSFRGLQEFAGTYAAKHIFELGITEDSDLEVGDPTIDLNLIGTDVKLNNKSLNKAYFAVKTSSTMAIPDDPNSPLIITGLTVDSASSLNGFQVEAALGGVRNVTGRTLRVCTGDISIHHQGTNGADREVNFYSERTTVDDMTWVKNPDSGRDFLVTDDEVDFVSKSSEAFDWPNNSVIRFRFFADTAGVNIVPVSFTAEGETVTGPSLKWWISEK